MSWTDGHRDELIAKHESLDHDSYDAGCHNCHDLFNDGELFCDNHHYPEEDFLDLGVVPATSDVRTFAGADLAKYVLDEPDSVFVCPPEWDIGPREFRALCHGVVPTRRPTIDELIGGFMVTIGAPIGALAAMDGSTGSAISLGTMAIGGAGVFVTTARGRRKARERYAKLVLPQVIEIPNAPEWVHDMAVLRHPSSQALSAMWRLAQQVDANPDFLDAKPQDDVVEPMPVIEPPKPTRWQVARERFEVVELEWEAILLDPLSALENSSLLGDVGKPLPAAFLLSFAKAKETLARLTVSDAEPSPGDVELFEDQALAASVNWEAAKHWAEHVGYDWLPEHERVHASTAQKLLAVAKDEDGATLAERINAAEKATKLLRRIHSFAMPKQSVEKLALMARPQILAADEAGESILREQAVAEEA